MNIARTLTYLAQSVYALGREYDYSGDLSKNTQAQYNALQWNDAEPKPAWSFLKEQAVYVERWYTVNGI